MARELTNRPVPAPAAKPGLADVVAQGLSAPLTILKPHVRRSLEVKLGESLAGVSVHSGTAARHSSAALGARAFTAGEHVVLGRHEDAADARSGVLAHELTHVIQNRRGITRDRGDRLSPATGAAEREAERTAALSGLGMPSPSIRAMGGGVALTPAGDTVRPLISYSLTDWAVTSADEARVLAVLDADPDLSSTVADLGAGMVAALFDRIDGSAHRRRLLQLMGARLNPAGRAVVEPHISRLGLSAELQYNLGRLGVTAGAAAFDPAPLEGALVSPARTPRTGAHGGHLTQPFTGAGATGVIPVTRHAGVFSGTPGVPKIPVEDKALLAAGHAATVATYTNPLPGSLPGYLATLSATQRSQQAELLLRRRIGSVEENSYAGSLPSRAQVIAAAARAHNLHPQLVAAFLLAEQRDQSQAEDAKDFQGATSLMKGNTSIGLGQVVVSTARRHDLFADLLGTGTRDRLGLRAPGGPGHEATARLLASDEFNIFAVARYLRRIADQGAATPPAALVKTAAAFPNIDMAAYSATRRPGRTTTSGPWARSTRRGPGTTLCPSAGPTSSSRPTGTSSPAAYRRDRHRHREKNDQMGRR
ncbi:DUF4157 domain-containing protein [Nonomuraea sp. NPDC046570]|uniref:DUF4157 domain-containing protein n=1 Tax=Nonomuraea sp. NPDC046570 TaxID=3155255 RepID=UPI0033F802C7